jgi:hypothetical protein
MVDKELVAPPPAGGQANPMSDKALLEEMRRALLMQVAAIEKSLGMRPASKRAKRTVAPPRTVD